MKLSLLLLTASVTHVGANNLRYGIASDEKFDVVALADGPVKSRPKASTTISLRNDAAEEQFGCLSTITSFADTLVSPIEAAIQSMDPINVGDEFEYVVEDFELPGGCTASTAFTADLGTLSGLDTTDISVSLVGGECSLWYGTFSATWRLTKTLTTLTASVGAHVQSEACGVPIDASVSGSAHIPQALFSMDVTLGGKVNLWPPISVDIDTAELANVDFDVESVVLEIDADGPLGLGDFNLDKDIETLVTDEIKDRVSAIILSTVNDAIGDILPITYPNPNNVPSNE